MDHYWQWVMLIDEIIFIGVFHSKRTLTTAVLINPTELGSDCCWWCIQIDSLLGFRVHESVAEE